MVRSRCGRRRSHHRSLGIRRGLTWRSVPITVGTGASKKKTATATTGVLVPPAVVTKMVCMLAASAGEAAVIVVSETTVKLVAGTGLQ